MKRMGREFGQWVPVAVRCGWSMPFQDMPYCFQAVMLCGSYANTDTASATISNQHVRSEALHATPVPTLTCMSPTDDLCGLRAQPAYWANLMTEAGPIRVADDSRLRIRRFEGWSHDEITSFFNPMKLVVAKQDRIHAAWREFLGLRSQS